jgi:hypothetical protein
MDPLARFVRHVRNHLDPRRAKHIGCFAPQLRELGETDFLARYIRRTIPRNDFQSRNSYKDAVMVLADERGSFGWFQVRAAEWPTDPRCRMYREQFAHTHAFALLTYGYFGPGYRTEIFTCDPKELNTAAIGDRLTLGPTRTIQLKPGRILHYPAFRVAHRQLPPDDYSISLNLCVMPSDRTRLKQYRIRDGRLIARRRAF